MIFKMSNSKIQHDGDIVLDRHLEGSIAIYQELLEETHLLPDEIPPLENMTKGTGSETCSMGDETAPGVICVNKTAPQIYCPGNRDSQHRSIWR
jgi:aspartate 1-decarboxylase